MRTTAPLNKLMVSFFILVPLLSVIGAGLVIVYHGFYWQTLVFAMLYAAATGIAITAGYHRLFAHRAYKAAWPVRLILMFFGTAAVQGSILEWCTDHRNHHRYTDKEGDPYSVTRGFWYAHIGWIFVLDPSKRNFDNIKDLNDDAMLRFQHKYFSSLAIFSSAILPVLVCSLWGDPLGGLFIAGGLRLTMNHHFTFFINSLCHYWGKRTYERGTARDNWFISLLTYGEGFHNFHHKFSVDYRNGIRWFHFDPSKWLIFMLAKMKLASQLKRIPKEVILQQSLDMREQQLQELQDYHEKKQWLQPLREQINLLQLQIKNLKANYQQAKAEKVSLMKTTYKRRLIVYRQKIKLTKKAQRRAVKSFIILADAMRTKHYSPII